MADADRSGRDETVLSRRGFLGRSTLAAGVLGAVSSRPVAAGPGPARGGTGHARHPLDPLSAEEIGEAARVVRADRSLGPACRFVAIALAEPAKSVVDGFRLGDPFPRGADVLVLDNATGRAHHGLVDLRSAVVQSYEPLPEGLQPSVTVDEFAECEEAVKRSPEFLAPAEEARGRRRRPGHGRPLVGRQLRHRAARGDGASGSSRALCLVRSEAERQRLRPAARRRRRRRRPEPHGGRAGRGLRRRAAAARGRQLGARSTCRRSATRPQAAGDRPARGAELHGRRPRGAPGRSGGSASASRPREGLVLHDVSYHDGGRDRPSSTGPRSARWSSPTATRPSSTYRKNAFDIGEYGIGTLANSLALGCDCLGPIRYFDAHMLDSRGKAVTIKNAVCLHEEDAGILWKHTDWRTDQSEVRRSRRLSVSIHRHGRQLRIRLLLVLLPGRLDPVRGEADRDHEHHGPGAGRDAGLRHRGRAPAATRRSTSTSSPPGSTWPSTASSNSVYEVNTVSPPRGPDNPHGNAFRAEATLLETEKAAQRARQRGDGPVLADRQPGRRRTAWVSRSAIGSCPARTAPPFVPARRRRAQAGRVRGAPSVGHAVPTRASGTPPATIRTSIPAATGCPTGPRPTAPVVDTDLVLWYVFAPHPRAAAGGLAGDAGLRARLLAQARRLLRAQPGAGRAGPERLTPVSRPYRARRRTAGFRTASQRWPDPRGETPQVGGGGRRGGIAAWPRLARRDPRIPAQDLGSTRSRHARRPADSRDRATPHTSINISKT